MARLTEDDVEQTALGWLEATGWRIAHGPDIAPDMLAAERRDYGEVLLAQRLRDTLLPKLISGELFEDPVIPIWKRLSLTTNYRESGRWTKIDKKRFLDDFSGIRRVNGVE